jgi:hypothetical protein
MFFYWISRSGFVFKKVHLLVYDSIILFFEPRRLFKPKDGAVCLRRFVSLPWFSPGARLYLKPTLVD